MNVLINSIKITILATILSFGVMLAVPASVFADAADDACSAIGGSTASDGCYAPGEGTLNNLTATIINIFSFVVGIVAVFMIIIGGFKYITSGGDANASKAARSTIIYAIVGLVVVAFAQIIVQFVIREV